MADKFQLKALITGVDKLSPALAGIRKNVASFRKQLRTSSLGDRISFGDLLQGGALSLPFVTGARAAIDFESAMADVKKVVDFDSPQQFKEMGQDVLELSKRLPMAAKEIAAIVAAGGQAGVARGELGRFAEDAVKMGVAFDQTAQQAGEMMATWRTAFKLGQDQVVQLADQINYLGNNGPAKASKISEVVTRIGALGQVAGFSAGQIAAMGATLAGMGVQEEIAATGLKNMMLTLTSGASATATQQQTFKALRMDARQLAVDMQRDAQGTMLRVLTAISKVDTSKQAAVLSSLFGRESIGAIAPLLTNMDLLRTNFERVGDAAQYAGSMNQEYASRAATTANNVRLFTNRITALGISVGKVLLPPLNSLLAVAGPLVDGVASLSDAQPWLIKGLLGAAVGFGVLRGAVLAATAATKVFLAVSNLTPIGIAVRLLALSAGFLVSNWEAVGPFFKGLWEGVKAVAAGVWEFFRIAFSFSPLGMIVSNWEPIVAWFRDMWDRIRPFVQPLMDGVSWLSGRNAAAPAASPSRQIGGGQDPGAWRRQDLSAGSAQAQLRGDMVVRFENAPPGLRVDPGQTNQPGLSITPRVGYRSLGGIGG